MKLLCTLFILVYFTACLVARAPAVACQVLRETVLMDVPGHTPPANQQYTIEVETVLPVVERVQIDGLGEWLRVRYGAEVEGYVEMSNCRIVEAR